MILFRNTYVPAKALTAFFCFIGLGTLSLLKKSFFWRGGAHRDGFLSSQQPCAGKNNMSRLYIITAKFFHAFPFGRLFLPSGNVHERASVIDQPMSKDRPRPWYGISSIIPIVLTLLDLSRSHESDAVVPH